MNNIPTQDDVITVDVRINHAALRAIVAQEVKNVIRRLLVETPVGDLETVIPALENPSGLYAGSLTTSAPPRRGPGRPTKKAAAPSRSRSEQRRIAVQPTFEVGTASAKPAASKPKPSPKKKAATKKAQNGGDSDAAQKKLIEVLESNPQGIRAPLLRAQLGWEVNFYQYHMKRAKDAKLVKIEGEKGGAIYYPNTKAIEKRMNGAAETAAP